MKTSKTLAALLAAPLALTIVAGSAAGQEEPKWATAFSDAYPAVSPDGEALLFHSNRDGGRAVYTAPAAGGAPQRLALQGDDPSYPVWSPDGASIAYAADIGENQEIFVARADGSGARRLTNHPGEDYHPRFSPDGRRVYFNSSRSTPDLSRPPGEHLHDIYSVAINGSDLRRHTHCGGVCTFPYPSPDGTRIAFRRILKSPGLTWGLTVMEGDSEVVTTRLDGTDEVNISRHPAFDGWPVWSPDGAHIYFASNRAGPSGFGQIWRAPAVGGPAVQITSGDYSHRQPALTADGKRLYVLKHRSSAGGDIGAIGMLDLRP